MLFRLTFIFLIQLLAIYFFSLGFFPKKNVLNGASTFNYNVSLQNNSKPVFDRLILVVIDALRSDFIFDKHNSNFHFVHSKLNSGEAWGFTAFANPPTVTLPRLKGITTGSTPSFLDAILNVAEDDNSSSISEQDSWLLQLRRFSNHRIRFFGDDTWLKLFSPAENFFDAWEGTNSFFVSDFQEVDYNVTRHIQTQINERDQWDTLILHYLGLDHIGHKGGAYSKFMPKKQIELDTIIQQLYEEIIDENSLLVFMGDHGMNDIGNHGGSSAGETHAGMVFMSPKLLQSRPFENVSVPLDTPLNDDGEVNFEYMKQIQQIDLVPTISTLFNVPIPKNSVGITISEFLPFLDNDTRLIKVWENFRQLSILNNEIIDKDFKLWDIDKLYLYMKEVQQSLTRSATNYNYTKLAIGYVFVVLSAILISLLTIKEMQFSSIMIMLVFISSMIGMSTFSSSFVEEEHQIWWWIITGTLLLIIVSRPKKKTTYFSSLIIFICLRLIRGWNNTGQKTVYSYVIGNLLDETPSIKWSLNCVTILWLSILSTFDYLSPLAQLILPVIILSYKINWTIVDKESIPDYLKEMVKVITKYLLKEDHMVLFENALIPTALIVYKLFSILMLLRIFLLVIKGSSKEKFIKSLFRDITMFLLYLSPSRNIPQYLLFDIIGRCATQILKDEFKSSLYLIPIVSMILQHFCFFQFGGSNSIATIDLSNAYHGISSDYNIYIVGYLMTVSNFAPAIYWTLFSWQYLYSKSVTHKNTNKWEIFAKSKVPFIFFNCIIGCCLFASCIILRYHLFIWSVFSPKLCYYFTWNLFMQGVVGWIFEMITVAFL